MAFCPNCGTPNTDQADKCVACDFELSPPVPSKFRGTLLMSSMASPESQPPIQSIHPEAARSAVTHDSQATTLAGHLGSPPPVHTSHRNAENYLEPKYGAPDSADYPQSMSHTGAGERAAPTATTRKPGPGKRLVLGCLAAIALVCMASGLAYVSCADSMKTTLTGGDDAEAEASAWRASISQTLAQVAAMCAADCKQAAVFFHADTQATLLSEAKALNADRVRKLSDPTFSHAEMLDRTDDKTLASKLGLDPQQCARVISQTAKVVSCSVPDPSGSPSMLRIVHLSGIDTL